MVLKTGLEFVKCCISLYHHVPKTPYFQGFSKLDVLRCTNVSQPIWGKNWGQNIDHLPPSDFALNYTTYTPKGSTKNSPGIMPGLFSLSFFGFPDMFIKKRFHAPGRCFTHSFRHMSVLVKGKCCGMVSEVLLYGFHIIPGA